MLIASLALRDLLRDRFFLFCNVAVMVGILVPLLLLVGVKNGVYQALLGELLSDPATLQIDTRGNSAFRDSDIDPIRNWPEVAFVTPKVRGQFDFMNVRAVDGRQLRPALIVPSGAGDPNLPAGVSLAESQVVISAGLAAQTGVGKGDRLQMVSQAEGRARQLVLEVEVKAVLPDKFAAGNAVLVPFAMLDLIEAFYESYSLPEYGIEGTRPLSERIPTYEGVRVYARNLESLAALQARLEQALDVSSSARTREVAALLGLGRKLDLALALVSGLAALGLGGALFLGLWSDVARKRQTLASIALLGVPARSLAWFPAVQAMLTTFVGLGVSLALYKLAAHVALQLFGDGLPGDTPLAVLGVSQGAAICLSVLCLALLAALLAGWSVLRLDPASVLRDET